MSHLCLPNFCWVLSGSIKVALEVREFGLDQFAFLLLATATIPGVITQEDNADLLALEQSYLDTLDLEYDIAEVAASSFGVRHSDETRAKMRANSSSEPREATGALNRGINYLLSLSSVSPLQH